MTSPSYATLRALHPGPPEGSAGFSLLTWNVLADALAESGGFVRAPQGSLAWEARRDALLGLVLAGEGSGRPPDVVCLQEVDRFADAFEPALRAAGYASLFVPKADGRDGCCLAFRRERFALRWAEPRRYLDAHGQNQVQHALLVALDDLRGEPPLLVATTHFKAKLEHAALRAAQARQLGGWARAAQARLGPDARLVVAGDLNDVPESAALAALRAVGLERLRRLPRRRGRVDDVEGARRGRGPTHDRLRAVRPAAPRPARRPAPAARGRDRRRAPAVAALPQRPPRAVGALRCALRGNPTVSPACQLGVSTRCATTPPAFAAGPRLARMRGVKRPANVDLLRLGTHG
ncbi:MAG: endonuclease/exonuclease/phosphatase family protein [Planctomycetota bacterium]